MPRKQDGPDRDVELLRTFVSGRARLQSERLPAPKADQAALEEAGPVRRPLAPLFEPDRPDAAPTTGSPAAAGKPSR
jgi:hypothetical protein